MLPQRRPKASKCRLTRISRCRDPGNAASLEVDGPQPRDVGRQRGRREHHDRNARLCRVSRRVRAMILLPSVRWSLRQTS